MMISGYDCWKRKGLSRRRKLESVGAETTSSGSPFQIRGPETLKVQLPTVDSRNIGTTRRLELAERSARRPCRSATQSSGPSYRGAVSWRTLYVSTAILYWMRSGTRSQCKVKVKPSTCIAPCMVKTTLKRSGMDHTVLLATNTMPALPRKRAPDGASTD